MLYVYFESPTTGEPSPEDPLDSVKFVLIPKPRGSACVHESYAPLISAVVLNGDVIVYGVTSLAVML